MFGPGQACNTCMAHLIHIGIRHGIGETIRGGGRPGARWVIILIGTECMVIETTTEEYIVIILSARKLFIINKESRRKWFKKTLPITGIMSKGQGKELVQE